MKKSVYKNKEIEKITLGESGIISFGWIGVDDLDFEVQVDWTGQEDLSGIFDFMQIKTRLVFEWVTDLKLSLDFGDQIRKPTIETFAYHPVEFDQFHVRMDCNSDSIGFFELKCNDFYFQIIEE